jgi:ApaG protein
MADPDRYDIRVQAQPTYLPEQSDEAAGRYAFAYTVTIENHGTVAAKLVSRHWIISDAEQRVQEVRGIGVVGEQPTIGPQERYRYTSGTTLGTPVGTMRGSYRMTAADGHTFDAAIPEFVLSMPRTLH